VLERLSELEDFAESDAKSKGKFRDLPRDREVIELFRKLSGPDP
jgi:hypothetical protein